MCIRAILTVGAAVLAQQIDTKSADIPPEHSWVAVLMRYSVVFPSRDPWPRHFDYIPYERNL